MAEKNIDFNEAKKLGLIAPNKIAEAETLEAAGGLGTFKPQSWWSNQLSSQINKTNFQEKSGSKLQIKSMGMDGNQFRDATPSMGGQTLPSMGFGQNPKKGVDYRYVDTFKDVTSSTLSKITGASKKQVESLQRQSGENSARKKRITRSTSGLLSGASSPSALSLSRGPQLGGNDVLSNGAMLGGKRMT
jgi:hypothetical protein